MDIKGNFMYSRQIKLFRSTLVDFTVIEFFSHSEFVREIQFKICGANFKLIWKSPAISFAGKTNLPQPTRKRFGRSVF